MLAATTFGSVARGDPIRTWTRCVRWRLPERMAAIDAASPSTSLCTVFPDTVCWDPANRSDQFLISAVQPHDQTEQDATTRGILGWQPYAGLSILAERREANIERHVPPEQQRCVRNSVRKAVGQPLTQKCEPPPLQAWSREDRCQSSIGDRNLTGDFPHRCGNVRDLLVQKC